MVAALSNGIRWDKTNTNYTNRDPILRYYVKYLAAGKSVNFNGIPSYFC